MRLNKRTLRVNGAILVGMGLLMHFASGTWSSDLTGNMWMLNSLTLWFIAGAVEE